MSSFLARAAVLRYKAAVHNLSHANARANLRRVVQFFGWKILPGLVLPLVLVIALLGNSFTGNNKTAQSLQTAADRALWVEGDVVKAEALYQSVLSDWPASALAGEAHAGLALLLEIDKQPSELIAEAFASAARLSPENADAGAWWIASGNHWQSAGEAAAAEQAYSNCISRHADQADPARLALANLKLSQGEIDVALDHFQSVADSESVATATIGRMGISVAYERMGDLESALAQLDESEGHGSERREGMVQRFEAIRH